MKQNARLGEQSEAPRRRWKPEQEQHQDQKTRTVRAHAESTQGVFPWKTKTSSVPQKGVGKRGWAKGGQEREKGYQKVTENEKKDQKVTTLKHCLLLVTLRPPFSLLIRVARLQSEFGTKVFEVCYKLECRKWGFKRWGFKEIRGYVRKKAFFLRFLDFPGALRTLWKRAKKAEKGRKRPISADFQEGRPGAP